MKKIIIILLLSFVIGSGIYADVVEDAPLFPYTYLFHLYYDNGQLFADRDFEFKYDMVAEEFVPETVNTQFPYKGEIISFRGEVVSAFLFDPRRGDPNFLKGKISVKASYAPNGQKAVFYDSQNRPLVTIFVSESSFCNEDGVCNSDRGEDNKTCSNDCRGATSTAPPKFEEPANGQASMLKAAIYVLIIAGAALGGWFGWRWWKKRKEPPTPQLPSNQQLPPSPNQNVQ